MKRKKWVIITIVALAITVVIFLLFIMVRDLWPLIQELIKNQNDEQKSVDYIQSFGLKGIPILITIEALLAATSLVSANPIHILVGLTYGVFWGSIIAIVGVAIGNAILFLAFRQFRKWLSPFIKSKNKRFLSVEKIEKMKYPEIIAAIAFAIPGFPDLIVPYVFSKIKISFWRYMLSITLAGIPGIILLTWAGNLLARGNWEIVAALVVLMVALVIVVFANRKRILRMFE
ncbi:VTT domain-containing protein [Candidatus Saccharibacteria bacterium]|nr:VTT domain-containing protein [Candidatus Saccharibacteria bacterium]